MPEMIITKSRSYAAFGYFYIRPDAWLAAIVLWSLSACLHAAVIVPSSPKVSATSYLLVDVHTGEVLVAKDADVRLPPASLTKMMTSYTAAYEIARGNFTLDDPVKISEKAWRMGGSKMWIEAGKYVRLEELLRGVIILSGNDASVAVAEHIAGDEAIYTDLMNQHLVRMGLENTHFANVTGWPAEEHYSTADDMAQIAIRLIKDFPDHYSMYKEKYYQFNKDIGREDSKNRNALLWRDDSVDGVKTGHTEEAGYCLVASAEREGMRLLSVVMGTPSEQARTSDSQRLLAWGYRYFESPVIYRANEALLHARAWGGEVDSVGLGLTEELRLTLPKGALEDLKIDTSIPETLQAPLQAGAKVGTVTLSLDGEQLAEASLIVLNPVEEGGFISGLWDAIALFFLEMFEADTISI
ncbi:MAG: D-alanyl-D-alanine carboxypeptidase [Gammaproteobacteria bacterium]|nr:D-alanyl-D-alanine carboxypeptidase [Gammaproteobacteria bacterium]